MNKMKKISIITIIFYMIFITSVFAATGTITVAGARLRKEANTESNILTKIYQGEQVEILEKNGDWYKVKYGNHIGYLKNTLLKEEISSDKKENTENNISDVSEKISDTTIITTKNTNIRYQPSFISNVIIKIDAGKELTKTDELGSWIKVTDGAVTGWITKISILDNISNIEADEKIEETEEKKEDKKEEKKEDNTVVEKEENNKTQGMSVNKKGKVNVETAKVRKSADKSSKVIGFLDYNDEITIISEEGEWYKFTEKSIDGYVHKTLITLSENISSRGTNEDRDEENKKAVTTNNSISNEVSKENENINKNDTKGQDVVEFAKKYLGYKYVVGGKNPETGFDCSGFTRYVFLQFGHSLGTTAAAQNNIGTEVSRENLKPGDLILFYDEGKTKIGHTGIYISNGDFIHSANPARGVVIDNINTNSYYNQRYIVAKRIV